jgi:hypothetical protein
MTSKNNLPKHFQTIQKLQKYKFEKKQGILKNWCNKENIPPGKRPGSLIIRSPEKGNTSGLNRHVEADQRWQEGKKEYNDIILGEHEFDHHSSPPHSVRYPSFKFHEDPTLIIPLSSIEAGVKPTSIPIPDLTEEQIEKQIEFWHDRESRITINSLKVDIDENDYKISIYKRTGSTAGQMIQMDVYETQQLILLLAHRIIPDIYESIKKGWTKLSRRIVSTTNISKVDSTCVDFTTLGVANDAICTSDTVEKPDPSTVLAKIQLQLSKSRYYEHGLYELPTLSVLINNTSNRWLIGLYKHRYELSGQCIWFSVHEAQWLVEGLIHLYQRIITRLELRRIIKNEFHDNKIV